MNTNTLGERKHSAPSINSSASGPPERFTIEGRPNSRTCIGAKLIAAMACVGLGVVLWAQGSWEEADGGSTMRAVAFFCFLIALLLPHHRYKYLDLKHRQIVAITTYGWLVVSEAVRPLAEFNRIVVRHVCHPGEGADTYTGSVGLKPVDGTAVVWVKAYPTTEDEVPAEASEFALALHGWIGLPLGDEVRSPRQG